MAHQKYPFTIYHRFPGVKLIEWPKRDFAEFEDGHVEIAIRVEDDGSRLIDLAATS